MINAQMNKVPTQPSTIKAWLEYIVKSNYPKAIANIDYAPCQRPEYSVILA